MFVIGVEVIIHLLLYNLHDCTFKDWSMSMNCNSSKITDDIQFQNICSKFLMNELKHNTDAFGRSHLKYGLIQILADVQMAC